MSIENAPLKSQEKKEGLDKDSRDFLNYVESNILPGRDPEQLQAQISDASICFLRDCEEQYTEADDTVQRCALKESFKKGIKLQNQARNLYAKLHQRRETSKSTIT